jgi:hypothetical protein
MITITSEKRTSIRRLGSKKPIKRTTLIKMIHREIIEMRKTFTLKEIMLMINSEFEQDIKYANFQRILSRMKAAENPPNIKESKRSGIHNKAQEPIRINTNAIDIEQLI